MMAMWCGYVGAVIGPGIGPLLVVAAVALIVCAVAVVVVVLRGAGGHEASKPTDEAHQGLEWTTAVLRGLHQAAFIVDAEGAFSFLNPAAEHVLGWKSAEVAGRKAHALLHPDHGTSNCPVTGALSGQVQTRVSDEVFARKDGSSFSVDFFTTPLMDGQGIYGSVVAFQPTERRQDLQRILDFGSLHDSLTGAPNRTLFFDRLYQLLLKSKRRQAVFAVVMFDIDGLRYVNEQYGNEVGDAVLQQVARRMRSCLRESDTLARLGGDEFAVLLTDTDEPGARLAAQRLVAAVGQQFKAGNETIAADVNFGVAMYPQDGEEADLLVRHADVAMYLSKRTRGTEAG